MLQSLVPGFFVKNGINYWRPRFPAWIIEKIHSIRSIWDSLQKFPTTFIAIEFDHALAIQQRDVNRLRLLVGVTELVDFDGLATKVCFHLHCADNVQEEIGGSGIHSEFVVDQRLKPDVAID